MKNKFLIQHKLDIFLMKACIFAIIALSGCYNHNQYKNWEIWPPNRVKDIEPLSVFVALCFSESSEIELSPILFNDTQADFTENSNKKLEQFEKLLTTQPDMRIKLDGPDALENKVKSYFLKKNIDRNRIITTSDCPYQCWEDFIKHTGDQILDERLRPHNETLYGYALVIGISNYGKDSSLSLKKPEEEARKMKKILNESGYRVKLLTDQNATRQNILKWLDIFTHCIEQEKFLFYFSGHGTTGICSDKMFYILTYPPEQPTNMVTHISFNEIMGRIKDSDAPEKLFIIDACTAKETRDYLYNPPAEYSYQLQRQGYMFLSLYKDRNLDGEFSPIIFDALQGEADKEGNKDSIVTMFEALTYINDNLKKSYLRQGIEENRIKYICYGSGDIPLTVTPDSSKNKKIAHRQ